MTPDCLAQEQTVLSKRKKKKKGAMSSRWNEKTRFLLRVRTVWQSVDFPIKDAEFSKALVNSQFRGNKSNWMTPTRINFMVMYLNISLFCENWFNHNSWWKKVGVIVSHAYDEHMSKPSWVGCMLKWSLKTQITRIKNLLNDYQKRIHQSNNF